MTNKFFMPSEGFIKLKAVQQITALSRSTILRRIEENKFPKPIKYGNILLFSVDAIRKFISDLSEQQVKNELEVENDK